MSGAPLAESAPPVLVVVAGRVASGKSTISRALAVRLDAERLEADRVRGTLLAATAAEASGAEARWRRDLAPEFEGEVYADLLRRADAVLEAGRSLVLDACFPRRSQRDAARDAARRHGAVFLFVECRVADEASRARLVARGPGWLEVDRMLAGHREPADEIPAAESLVVDGEAPVEESVGAILARLPVALRQAAPKPRLSRMPRVVSFDCWSTLIVERDWPWAVGLRVSALCDAAAEAGTPVARDAAERAFEASWQHHLQLWEEGRATGARDVAEWALAELGLGEPHPALEHLVRRFEEASHTSHVVALDGAPELLRALRRAGVGRVLVCDTGLTPGRVVRRLLDRVGLLEPLEVLAFSDEVTVPKPDRRIFLTALERLGIGPEDALHVGDLRRTDVAGARALGMTSVRIRAHHDDVSELPEADHVVDSHADLARLLGLSPLRKACDPPTP